MKGKAVATVDVQGAYLRAEMPKVGNRLNMRQDKLYLIVDLTDLLYCNVISTTVHLW